MDFFSFREESRCLGRRKSAGVGVNEEADLGAAHLASASSSRSWWALMWRVRWWRSRKLSPQ